MTPTEWIEKMKARGQKIRDERILFHATTGTMLQMSERIWGRGGLSDGGTLKYNENYEVYAYKPPSPVKPSGKGKPNAEGKVKKIKGGWYPTYLAYKKNQSGRDKLPFELTGDMRISWFRGATPAPVEVDPTLCVIQMPEAQAKKAEGLAKQKGEFLRLTKEEREAHHKRIFTLYQRLFAA